MLIGIQEEEPNTYHTLFGIERVKIDWKKSSENNQPTISCYGPIGELDVFL